MQDRYFSSRTLNLNLATQLDSLKLLALALAADDSLLAAVALAHWPLEVLSLLSTSNDASLLHFTGKATKQVLE